MTPAIASRQMRAAWHTAASGIKRAWAGPPGAAGPAGRLQFGLPSTPARAADPALASLDRSTLHVRGSWWRLVIAALQAARPASRGAAPAAQQFSAPVPGSLRHAWDLRKPSSARSWCHAPRSRYASHDRRMNRWADPSWMAGGSQAPPRRLLEPQDSPQPLPGRVRNLTLQRGTGSFPTAFGLD